MPPTYCPCPRPILKRRSPSPERESAPLILSPRDESAQLLNIDPSVLQPLVHFAPPSGLTHTFYAYSPSIYDRSPIVVSPNRCSLPERGCPGKTYLPGDDCEELSMAMAFASTRHRSGKKSRDASPAGRHLHPRAARAYHLRDSDEDDDELTPKATPLADSHPLPPLIPDVSSSSDSEESDGFVSPPMENTGVVYAPLYATSLSSATATPARTPGLSIPIPPPDLSVTFSSMYLSPISSPTSPISFRSRMASYSPRSVSPARSISPSQSPRSHSPCRDATSPTRRRRPHPKTKRVRGCSNAGVTPASPSELEEHYKAFSEHSVLNACALDASDEGCLGGF